MNLSPGKLIVGRALRRALERRVFRLGMRKRDRLADAVLSRDGGLHLGVGCGRACAAKQARGKTKQPALLWRRLHGYERVSRSGRGG